MNTIKGGVTAAKGFKAAGCEAQIKYKNGKKDMALVYSEKPCVTAGTFTTNKVFAAPVKWDRNIVYNEDFAQAVVVNVPAVTHGFSLYTSAISFFPFLYLICASHPAALNPLAAVTPPLIVFITSSYCTITYTLSLCIFRRVNSEFTLHLLWKHWCKL
jgi:hypothetical protein